MKKTFLTTLLLSLILNSVGAQQPGPQVSVLMGTLRTPYFYLFTELSGKSPGIEILDRWWQLSLRSRAFGTFWFFSTQSMDWEVLVETPFLLGNGFTVMAQAGLEMDYRNTSQIRSAAKTTLAPVLGGELVWDGHWIEVRGALESLIFQDGLSLKLRPEVRLHWLKPLGFVLKAEFQEVGSFTRNLWEYRWETYAGFTWEF